MHFSFSSLINMTVACCILTGIFYLLLRHNKMLSHFGTSLVLGVTSIVILRFLIPVELPFTKSVYIYNVYPDIYHFFIDDFATINGFSINLCRLLAGVWITGSVLLFCRSIRVAAQNFFFFFSKLLTKTFRKYFPILQTRNGGQNPPLFDNNFANNAYYSAGASTSSLHLASSSSRAPISSLTSCLCLWSS